MTQSPTPIPEPEAIASAAPHQARLYLVSMYFLSSGSAAPTTSLVTWLGSGLGLALELGLALG